MARLKRHRDRIVDPMGRRRLTRNEKIGIGSLATLLGVMQAPVSGFACAMAALARKREEPAAAEEEVAA